MRNAIVALLLAGALAGCQSTRPAPPCEPELVPKPYPVPVFVGVWIPVLPPMELPAYPDPPIAGASEEEWKTYALDVRRITKERAAIRDARILALVLQIEANNQHAAEHPAPTPTPAPPPG